LREPVDEVAEQAAAAGESVERMTRLSEEDAAPVVAVDTPDYLDLAFANTQLLAGQSVIGFIVLYLALASGQGLLREVLRLHPACTDADAAEEMLLGLEQALSKYLATIIAINVCLGSAIGGAMSLLGMPNPTLWGVMAFALNFVPYLGALTGATVVAGAAFVTFDSLGMVALAGFLYLGLSSLEGMVLTPMILGSRMYLDPLVLLLSVLFWGSLWGVPGTLMAVPLLLITKDVCQRLPGLELFARILSGGVLPRRKA
jgi:predicted PurR-regulated permease PerM